ncbi:hypothetical protein D9M71_271110 [compost metagenome]
MLLVDLPLVVQLGIQVEVGLAERLVAQADTGAHALRVVGAVLPTEQHPAIHRQGAAVAAGLFAQGVVPHGQLHVLRLRAARSAAALAVVEELVVGRGAGRRPGAGQGDGVAPRQAFVGTALAVLAGFQAAIFVVAVDQVLLHIKNAAQLATCRSTVFDFVVAQGQRLAKAVVLGEVVGGALQVGDRLAALGLVRRAGQAHAVVGAAARLVGGQAHGFGQPGGALRAVAGQLCGVGGGIVVVGPRVVRQALALETQRGLVIALALGDGGAQGPVVGAVVCGGVPIAPGRMRVAGVQRATGGGEAGVVGPGTVGQAAPDGQRGLGVASGLKRIGQRQAVAAVAQALGGLVVDHRFAGLVGHGAAAQGAVLAGLARGGRYCLAHGVALASLGQAAKQLGAGIGVDPGDQAEHASAVQRPVVTGIQVAQALQQRRGKAALAAVVGLLQQLPCVFVVALLHQQEGGLLQRGQVAALLVALLPFGGSAWLRGLRRVAVQALLEHSVGTRVGAGGAALELLARQLRVALRQPVDGFQAGALQFVAQALYQRGVVAFAGQFPQLLALLGLVQLFGRQCLQPTLGLLVLADGDGAVGHGQAGLVGRLGGRGAG